jgi:hypothetical protein
VTTNPPTDQRLTDDREQEIRTLDLAPLMSDRSAAIISGHLAALLDEVDQLRAKLAAEQSTHAFTLRQRNNRSERLNYLRDVAKSGQTGLLVEEALNTLAASVNDHVPADSDELAASLKRDGFGDDEIAEMLARPVRTPCSVPECGFDGTGEPCTRHEREADEPQAEPEPCTRQCGHDDYHDAHEWADRPGVWCSGHSHTADQAASPAL